MFDYKEKRKKQRQTPVGSEHNESDKENLQTTKWKGVGKIYPQPTLHDVNEHTTLEVILKNTFCETSDKFSGKKTNKQTQNTSISTF